MPELQAQSALNHDSVVELPNSQTRLSVIPGRVLLRLRVPMNLADIARDKLAGLLPEKPLGTTNGEPGALWMAPDTWLVVSHSSSFGDLAQDLAKRLTGTLHASTNQSDALVLLRLQGAGASKLLSRGCGLNFSETAFPPGHCSKTRFAHLPLMIHRPRESDCFELLIDRSYAAALWDWLLSQ